MIPTRVLSFPNRKRGAIRGLRQRLGRRSCRVVRAARRGEFWLNGKRPPERGFAAQTCISGRHCTSVRTARRCSLWLLPRQGVAASRPPSTVRHARLSDLPFFFSRSLCIGSSQEHPSACTRSAHQRTIGRRLRREIAAQLRAGEARRSAATRGAAERLNSAAKRRRKD